MILILCLFFFQTPTQEIKNSTVNTFITLHKKIDFQKVSDTEKYSVYINGPSTDAKSRQIVLERNPNTHFFIYQNMIDIEKNNTPWADDIFNNHPDFLLKTIDGNKNKNLAIDEKNAWGYIPAYNKKYKNRYFLNPASDGWADYYSALIRKNHISFVNNKNTGIFVDNVWPFYTLFFRKAPLEKQVDMNGDGKMDSTDDWAWSDAVIKFSLRVQHNFEDSVKLIANFGTRFKKGSTAYHILEKGGFYGVMNEGFIRTSVDTSIQTFPKEKTWREDINSIIEAEKLRKINFNQSTGDSADCKSRLFCLGSYLLGAGKFSYYNYKFHDSFDVYYRLPEFDLDLGKPLQNADSVNVFFDFESKIYKRKFEKGEVWVNPSKDKILIHPEMRKVYSIISGTKTMNELFLSKELEIKELNPFSAIIMENK